MGTIRKVDTSGGWGCIGRFLRVKIRSNIREPIIRGTFVEFPDEGRIWVDFKYESLPKYCLICRLMGHSTRVCRDLQEVNRVVGEDTGHSGGVLPYRGLDVVVNLWGNALRTVFRGAESTGSNGWRYSPERRRNERSNDWVESRMTVPSLTLSGVGGQG